MKEMVSPKTIPETQKVSGKILTCFSFLAVFLEVHKDFFMVWGNNQIGRK